MNWANGRHPSASAASSAGTRSTRICPKSRRPSSRSSTTSRSSCAGLGSEGGHAVRRHRQAVPLPATSTPSSPTTGASVEPLTLNLGVRYEFFGWPEEMNGRIGNVDFDEITNTENPPTGSSCRATSQTPALRRLTGDQRHRTREQQAHAEGPGRRTTSRRASASRGRRRARPAVVRGGYGVFFDRPSAAFINTVFSNYPFLRESEVTFPSRQCR